MNRTRKKIKIIGVIGARPNFIKVAPLAKAIKKEKRINFVLVHTGQHYDFLMSEIFFKNLNIPKPDYNLNIGPGSQAWQIAKIMIALGKICLKEKPDWVLAVGDVNSSLAAALTAANLNIRLCHLEAGVRSFDLNMPEEINRVLTDRVSSLFFCPTKTSVENLKKEGIKKGVYNTGDIMYEAFLLNIKTAEGKSNILKVLNLKEKSYFLFTLHRPVNSDSPEALKNIIEAVAESGEKIIFPCHPRTEKQIKKAKIRIPENLKIIKPVGYLDMLKLEKNSKKIITDSGGVQREAFWLKIPCITLRNSTEWPETVENKWNVLAGSDKSKITEAIENFEPGSPQKSYFGGGETSKKIIEILLSEK